LLQASSLRKPIAFQLRFYAIRHFSAAFFRKASYRNGFKKNIYGGFTGASNPLEPDCIRLRLLQYASLSEPPSEGPKTLLYGDGCGHRALAVRRLHPFRDVSSRHWCSAPSPSFVLLIVTSSLMTAGRAGAGGKKSAKPSRLRGNKKAKNAF
jgi:hypothetical protein